MLITFLLVTQGIIKSVIISIVENSIDNIAGNPYDIEARSQTISLAISDAKETIAAEGTCIKRRASYIISINGGYSYNHCLYTYAFPLISCG